MGMVRPPAVAGSFYPADAQALRAVVREHLEGARASFAPPASWPKALIVPHAGYMYSGPVAAHAYLTLEAGFEVIDRVVLVGPSHHVAFSGLAVPSNTAFETPLGRVPIDEDNRRRVLELPFVHTLDDAHHWEHSLEVQLPFLQELLDGFRVLPLALGRAASEDVAAVLDLVWGGDETVVVISSDLSHYHGYEQAKRMDASTAAAIERLDASSIGLEDACGAFGIGGLLATAKARGLDAHALDLRSSGDTAGGRDEVVGYGAWAFTASRNGSP
jgi:AmmeMemoRadiSam system protein B